MESNQNITGARFIAETLKGYGVTHVFYVDAILRKTMVDLEELGIRRVITHSEKAAAYMADGYARVSHKPGCAWPSRWGRPIWRPGCKMPFWGDRPWWP